MSEIRRDKKGRKLKDGESQRKDGRYQFRYTDISGERRYLYDWDLDKLRAKEKDISFQLYCQGSAGSGIFCYLLHSFSVF